MTRRPFNRDQSREALERAVDRRLCPALPNAGPMTEGDFRSLAACNGSPGSDLRIRDLPMQSSADAADQPTSETHHVPQGNRREVLHVPIGLAKRRHGHVGFPRYQEQVDLARPSCARTYPRNHEIKGLSGLPAPFAVGLAPDDEAPQPLFPLSRVKPTMPWVRGPGVSARIRLSLCCRNAAVPPQTRVPPFVLVFPDPVDSGRLGSVAALEAHQAIPPSQTACSLGTRTTFAALEPYKGPESSAGVFSALVTFRGSRGAERFRRRDGCRAHPECPTRSGSMALGVPGGEGPTDRVGGEESILHGGDAELEGLVVRAFARSNGALRNLPRLLGRQPREAEILH